MKILVSPLAAFALFVSGSVLPAEEPYTWEEIPPTIRENLRQSGVTEEVFQRYMTERSERSGTNQAEVEEEARPETIQEAATVTLEAQEISSQIIPRPWPGPNRAIPLQAETRTVVNDGIFENFLFLSGISLNLLMDLPAGLTVAQDPGDASCRLVSRAMPINRLDFYLFPAGTFLPSVNKSTLSGYQLWLEEEFGDQIVVDRETDILPDMTFAVLGERWGLINYRREGADAANFFVEYFVPIPPQLLVIRLSGSQFFVDAMRPQIRRSLSTLSEGSEP